MSGGVDSAVAALLVSDAGEDAVAVTLELWSDPENDGELSCCSAQAVRGARALAHELGMPHLSIDLRAEFRAGRRRRLAAGPPEGLTPNPCVRCNGNVRLDAMLELAERLGAQTLATGHYARVQRRAAAADGQRRPQGPELRAVRAVARPRSRACASRSARCTSPRCASWPSAPGCRWRAAATRRTCASSRAPARSAFCCATATSGGDPGRSSTSRACSSASTPGATCYTVGQRHGLGIGGAEPLYVLATDTATNTVTVGPRPALLIDELPLRELTLHRDGGCVDGVRVRSHGRLLPCRLDGSPSPGEHRDGLVRLERRWSARRRDSSPACTPASWSWGTARSPPTAERRPHLRS